MPAGEETFIPISNGLGTGSSGTIDFTNIPNTYTDLVILGVGQSTIENAGFRIRFNNDTSTACKRQTIITEAQANTMFAEYLSQNNFYGGNVPAIAVMPLRVDIAGYKDVTYFYPTIFIRGGNPVPGSGYYSQLMTGTYTSKTAVSSIQIYLDSGNWTTNTRFTLYGILKA